jgi:hypothetical protein
LLDSAVEPIFSCMPAMSDCILDTSVVRAWSSFITSAMEGSFVSPMAAGADVAVDEGDGGGGWEVDAAAVEDWEVVVEDRRD